MMPSSNTLTLTWRTARSRVPPPPTGCFFTFSHHPQTLTHFECCMNLVGGPCPLRPPDTSTSYRVNVCAIFPGPGTTQPWLFPGGQLRLSPAPWLLLGRWGSGLGWEGAYPTQPLPLPFCFQMVGSKKVSSAWAWGKGGYQKTPGAPLAPPQMSVFLRLCSVQGMPPCGVSEPSLHTDASSSIPWPGQDSPFPAGQPCSPPLPTLERRGRTLEDWEHPV